jgi:hypothetical protein
LVDLSLTDSYKEKAAKEMTRPMKARQLAQKASKGLE